MMKCVYEILAQHAATYIGAATLLVDSLDGSLEIKGAIGSFKFARPYAYELDAQGNIIPGTLFYPVYSHTSGGIILIDNISYNVGNALVVVMERASQAYQTPPGIYLVRVFTNNEIVCGKLLVH